ncbi:MAG: DNA starvation/stationary phase protection protein Dps, partial [Thermoflexales bacterium]|nr:DNA starvation/stationary phase protection protein Dps [Thermoflexales bacterium]
MIATKVIHTTRNDLSLDVRTRMIALLNQHLANLSDLYTQTKHAHWNVQGAQFYSLHKLYDELAEALEHYIDDIAERAVQLGGEAAGTMRMAAAHSQLPEYP